MAALNKLLDLLTTRDRPLIERAKQAILGSKNPHINHFDAVGFNVKFFGYELARALAAALPVRTFSAPPTVGLKSKPSTQADIESDWVAYWSGEMKSPVIFHRKVWELTYVLQAIHEAGFMEEGRRGLGFGCGTEPLPSLMASKGLKITVTDLQPEKSAGLGWTTTGQHTSTLDHCFQPHLVSREDFARNVELEYVDMNNIPATLRDYDFCWSVCAYEHLGSIQAGIDFVVNSMDVLKPGGRAVHTTEFNFSDDVSTLETPQTVLFQKRHFIEIARRLRDLGHEVAELDFDIGDKPLDKFIDFPPFGDRMPGFVKEYWGELYPHIKIALGGFCATCFGIVATKKK